MIAVQIFESAAHGSDFLSASVVRELFDVQSYDFGDDSNAVVDWTLRVDAENSF
jgi:hypothetical protein